MTAAPRRLMRFAAAKINLCLHITGRRDDGYHELDSLVCFAGARDRLHAEPAVQLSLEIDGPFGASLGAAPDNLVVRAARLLRTALEQPAFARAEPLPPGAALRLEKHLPVASGIGGGSADAAAALRLLAELWAAPPALMAALPRLALKLGADVPVCLVGRPARMRGIGEILDPVDLPAFALLLVNPGVGVPTAAVFAAWRERGQAFSAPLPAFGAGSAADLAAYLQNQRNDLEAPAIALCPVIAEALAAIRATPGCLLARMSGSGATCFGLYQTQQAAILASRRVSRAGWWVWPPPPEA